MPYIKSEDREHVNRFPARTSGELNYELTQVCLTYLQRYTKNYQYYNDVIGALECCKLEMYRRAIAPYEDSKKEANGDVY